MRSLAGVLERLYLVPPPDIESNDVRELTRIAGLGLYVRRLGKQTVIDLARAFADVDRRATRRWFRERRVERGPGRRSAFAPETGTTRGRDAFNFLPSSRRQPRRRLRPARSNITQTLSKLPGVKYGAARVPWSSRRTVRPLAWCSRKAGRRFRHRLSHRAPRARHAAAARDRVLPGLRARRGQIKARGVVARATVTSTRRPPTHTLHRPSLDYLERAYDDAKYGKDSTAPYV